jgi:D-glycero-alpha-D-manno-heptose-7-phosphate kinase
MDLAGGTIDIWPLYLFHDNAQTLNVAINLRASCRVTPEPGGHILITSADTRQTVKAQHWSELRDNHELKLLGRILNYFQASGVHVETASKSPVGAGIAGSSALNIAVCGALAAWTNREIGPDTLFQIAMNVEAQAIDVPTGVQDYRPAYYGGVSAVELDADGVRRVGLKVDPAEIESRIVLAYTRASRNSGINNWEVTKRHIDGDRQVFDSFERIRDIAVEMRAALERGDWQGVARQIDEEWTNRKRLAPGVTTPEIDRIMAAAKNAGALATKICGAGGGGCMIAFAQPDAVPAVKSALTAAGAQVLAYHVETEGLRVEHVRPGAPASVA